MNRKEKLSFKVIKVNPPIRERFAVPEPAVVNAAVDIGVYDGTCGIDAH
jgi:hypothetical protein